LNLASLARGLGDVFFPPVCVGCRGLVEEGPFRHLCGRCGRLLALIRAPLCPTCGHPFAGAVAEEGACPHCADLAPAFGSSRSAVLFRGAGRALLLELKYHRGRFVLGDLEEVFRRSPDLLAHVRDAVLVPVPLHPRKRRERGYNQGALVASALARAAGGRTRVEPILRREIDTPTQTVLDRRERAANLAGAFALAGSRRPDPGLRYVIVDDVFTTGSTLDGCARVLRRSGCPDVDAATYGRG
jgi:ComF family protein